MIKNFFFGFKSNRKLTRAALVLFPLFGLTFAVCFYLPKDPTTLFSKIYYFVNVFLQTTQGVWVAFVYCFLNDEVQRLPNLYFNYNQLNFPLGQECNKNKAKIVENKPHQLMSRLQAGLSERHRQSKSLLPDHLLDADNSSGQHYAQARRDLESQRSLSCAHSAITRR